MKMLYRNRSFRAVTAQVYKAPSWRDGKECIVLDYSKTSIMCHYVRDEIREIKHPFYLGSAYWGTKRVLGFALKFTGK